jgi:hypothetical protein
MRGSFPHGARYNIRGYFGTLYASFSPETARREMARYFTVAPRGGFVGASISLRLKRDWSALRDHPGDRAAGVGQRD